MRVCVSVRERASWSVAKGAGSPGGERELRAETGPPFGGLTSALYLHFAAHTPPGLNIVTTWDRGVRNPEDVLEEVRPPP